MIDEMLTRSLDLRGENQQLYIQWFGGKGEQQDYKRTDQQKGKSKRYGLRNVGMHISNLNLPLQTLRRENVRAAQKCARLSMKTYSKDPQGFCLLYIMRSWKYCTLGMQNQHARMSGAQISEGASREVPQDHFLDKVINDYLATENFEVKPAPPVAASGNARALGIINHTTRAKVWANAMKLVCFVRITR